MRGCEPSLGASLGWRCRGRRPPAGSAAGAQPDPAAERGVTPEHLKKTYYLFISLFFNRVAVVCGSAFPATHPRLSIHPFIHPPISAPMPAVAAA